VGVGDNRIGKVWTGFYTIRIFDPIPSDTGFNILLFDDEAELPDVPAFYFEEVTAKREPTGFSTPGNGLPIFKFTAKLPNVPELEPGDYWLSITDNSTFSFAWHNSAEDPTDKLVLRHDDNEEFTTLTNSDRQNQAFTLHGKQIAEEITICHKRRTVTISERVLPKHLRHGDTIGAC